MRQLVFDLLSGDVQLNDAVNGDIYQVNAYENVPPRPYIIFRLSTETPRQSFARSINLQVWIHDDEGDYSRIDDLLEQVKDILLAEEGTGDLFAFEWIDSSEDLWDDVSNTIFRYGRFEIVRKG